MRARPLVLLALLLAAPAPAGADATDEPALRVVSLRADYALEEWKDEPAVLAGLAPLPRGARGVYANPYASEAVRYGAPAGPTWWGYRLVVEVEALGVGGPGHELRATIPTDAGVVPAKLAKLSSTRFLAEFDLDGERGRDDLPALGVGARALRLELVHRNASGAPTVLAASEEPLDVVAGYVDKAAFTLPEALLPGYADVMAGDQVPFYATRVLPAEPFVGSAVFLSGESPVARAAAEVVAVHGRGRHVVWTGESDANGRVAFSIAPKDALGARDAGLVLLEAHLTGGTGGRLASVLLALPASPHPVAVAGVAYDADGDAVRVSVVERAGSDARAGAVHALRGSDVLASAELAPASFASGRERQARLDAEGLRSGGAASYGLLAFLVREDGGLHAFATASRGLDVGLAPLEVAPRERAAFRVLVRSFNDNFDRRADAGLQSVVTVSVTGVPGADTLVEEVTLDEGGEAVLDFPLPAVARRAGTYALHVRAVMGELVVERATTLVVREPPSGIQRAVGAVPEPGAPLLLVALGAAAAVAAAHRGARMRR